MKYQKDRPIGGIADVWRYRRSYEYSSEIRQNVSETKRIDECFSMNHSNSIQGDQKKPMTAREFLDRKCITKKQKDSYSLFFCGSGTVRRTKTYPPCGE